MKFPKKELQKMADGDRSEVIAWVDADVTGASDWSVSYKVVFQDVTTGKHYLAHYSEGATEAQGESPFDHEPDEIECAEVERQQVSREEWVEVQP